MTNSQAAFYETISDMYHLDDDFSDRGTHFRHGVQMLAGDFVRALKSVLRRTVDGIASPSMLELPPDPVGALPGHRSRNSAHSLTEIVKQTLAVPQGDAE